MTSVWTRLCFMTVASLSMMAAQADTTLDDVFITPSATNITLGSQFSIKVDTDVSAFITATLLIALPNGTVQIAASMGVPPTFELLPPNVPVTSGNSTTQWNGTESSYCVTKSGLHGGLGYTPSVTGTYTFMPYIQYSFGTTGYSYKNGSVCINAPYIVETVPVANITVQVNPSDNGQTSLSSIPTTLADLSTLTTTLPASLVAEPTGDPFTLPSSGIKRFGISNIGLSLILSFYVIVSWFVRV